MGMFDYIVCEAELPETPMAPPGDFQTKDTPDQYMTVYTITSDGRLIWRPYDTEIVPESERPFPNNDGFLGLVGSMRRIKRDPEELPYHGYIDFYTCGHSGGWWEYRAKFTDGRLVDIELLKFEAPEQNGTGT